jgi:hypothetical protein
MPQHCADHFATPERVVHGYCPVCRHVVRLVRLVLHLLWSVIWVRTAVAAHLSGTAADLLRSKPDLLIENALLRHQLVVLRRSGKRPRLSRTDRTLLVLLAGRLRSWRQALLISQPDTLWGADIRITVDPGPLGWGGTQATSVAMLPIS